MRKTLRLSGGFWAVSRLSGALGRGSTTWSEEEGWLQQWDGLLGRRNMYNGHLRGSTPACNREEEWRQGVWARQQLLDN